MLSSVRAGSVPQRSHTGISGHQHSPSVHRNRRSPALQLKQQGRCRRAIRIVVPKVASAPSGSRRAATGVRNDREARPQPVEDHDRRTRRRRPLTWRFSRVLPGPLHHAVPCRNAWYRSRTEEARGSNPLTSTPNIAGQSAVRFPKAALTAGCGRSTAASASHSPAGRALSDQATRA
jgi:hypothetical protein